MKLFVSKNEKRAVFEGKRCRFVPYPRTKAGTIVPPKRTPNGSYRGLCACVATDGFCQIIGPGFRDRKTTCGTACRKDQTYGYWKEIK